MAKKMTFVNAILKSFENVLYRSIVVGVSSEACRNWNQDKAAKLRGDIKTFLKPVPRIRKRRVLCANIIFTFERGCLVESEVIQLTHGLPSQTRFVCYFPMNNSFSP